MDINILLVGIVLMALGFSLAIGGKHFFRILLAASGYPYTSDPFLKTKIKRDYSKHRGMRIVGLIFMVIGFVFVAFELIRIVMIKYWISL